jgi:battenin
MFFTEKLEKLWLKQYSVFVVVCYFFLGLCNNFAYVVMLSAAHDILSGDETKTNSTSKSTENGLNKTYNKYDCNELSTGTILLADILPGYIYSSKFFHLY